MKSKNIIILFAIVLLFSSCEDKFTREYMANSPIYMSYDELRASIKQVDAKDLDTTGKIYFKDDYIFIINPLQGIHIIDNSDPSNPTNTTYIEIPGCIDMAAKDNILYVDSYVDMVSLDISDINSIKQVDRISDVLPYTLPPYDDKYPIAFIDHELGVVIGWEVKIVREEQSYYNYPIYFELGLSSSHISGDVANGSIGSQGVGIGGSMARFGILDETLYAVDDSQLNIFDISNTSNPVKKSTFYVGWNVETMFLYDDKAFFGTSNGMTIYDLTNRYSPNYISEFWHVTSCDPVVIQGDYAYITLRGGNDCGNEINALEVVSITDISNPELISSYPMDHPYGLGIDGNTLFVCDGESGLKIYNTTDPLTIDENIITTFPDIDAFDVIPLNNILLLIGQDGLYQYSYSDLENIELLSTINISLP